MPDHLETLVRDALRSRASGITADLPPFPTASPTRLRTAALAGISALVVVALAIGAVLIFGPKSSGHSATGATGLALTGSRWTLASVTVDGQTIETTAEPQYVLAFPSKTEINLDDSVNFLSGTYQLTASGFSTRNVASTAVGYDGSDPNRVLLIAAIDAIGYRENAEVNSVQAHRQGDQLLITAGKYQLTFIRAGDASPVPTAPGTTAIPDSPISNGDTGGPTDGATSSGFSGSGDPCGAGAIGAPPCPTHSGSPVR